MTLSAAPRISCEVIETRADRARIFNLQRYSLNDGQGIRTVVFFKGCPTPARGAPTRVNFAEDSDPAPGEQMPALRPLPAGRRRVSLRAWEQIGRDVTLDNLLQEVLKDEVFFRASGGGVTLSGGRCSCRPGLPPAFFSACASGDPHRHRNRGRRRL
jgi:pyruvate formate lyase activating enzyme